MYKLFIANKNYSSWSLRPWVLMRTLGIDFDEQLQQFDDGGSWESFRAFSPTGLVPCLVDGETIVWESLGIVEYLAERHAGVWPADSNARTWTRCAAAEMHAGFSTIRNACPMTCSLTIELHDQSDALNKDLARLAELFSEGLDRFGGPFLGGADFSAVDAFFAPVALRVRTYQLPLATQAADYLERLVALPAMQQWLSDAAKEPWREAEHEEEIRALGTWLEDRRL